MRLIKILIFFCLILYLNSIASGQKIYEAKSLTKGIYTSVNEVINNSPSIPLNYKIKKISWQIKGRKKDTMFSYSLIIDDKAVKELGSVFGFCDGEHVYFNQSASRTPDVKNEINSESANQMGFFLKIKHLNRLAYYISFDFSNVTNPISGRVFNIDTGELTYVNGKSMRYLLGDNKSLLSKFDNEPKKNKKNQEILEQYYLELIANIK